MAGNGDSYVCSFRFFAAWAAEGEEGQEHFQLELGQDPMWMPQTLEPAQFLDSEVFATAAAPPGDRRKRVSPVYSMICGPDKPGVFEGGSGNRVWRVEATVSPNDDGTVHFTCRHDLERVTPNETRIGPRDRPGVAHGGDCRLGEALPVYVTSDSLEDSSYLTIYQMIERAWP